VAVALIARADVLSYQLPFQRELVTARTRARERSGWLLRLQGTDGRVGWGDAACWPGFGGGVAATRCALEALAGRLPGQDLTSVAELRAWTHGIAAPEAAHAVELAALDLLAQQAGRPLAHLLGGPRRGSVACQALVADAAEAARAVAAGHTALKVKVGATTPSADDRRLGEIRAAVGPGIALRLDANGAWTVSAALSCLDRFSRHSPEWIEQPVSPRNVDGLAWVRARSGVPVAADEAIRDEASLRDLLEAEAVDVVVLKPMFLGGPLRTLELAALAHAEGCRTTVTHALESAVGRTGALHTASALPDEAVCGLSNPLAEDVAVSQPVVAGRLRLPAQPGLGIEVTRACAREEVGA
jgi:o-succinylbenzoate synthase